jgi:hypothetical protein
MVRLKQFIVSLLFFVLASAAFGFGQSVATAPPMGWNSWDAYGLTVNESQFKANATVLAGMKQFGWKYAVIDEGWYMANPAGRNLAERKYEWNGNGLLVPDPARFPSAADGAGFKPLADWTHAQGLKFGIHIVRGIPRQVVQAGLPVEGSNFQAAGAADTSSTCPWDDGNYGVAENAAGQAYYNSMLKLYAAWGVDFLKVDCISNHPYRVSEIRQVAAAIRKTGRPIVLSLSPGPTALEHAAEVAQYAQMWRISDDHWDVWSHPHEPGKSDFPSGIREAFDLLGHWYPYTGPGSWPDADMLPEGWLGPNPGWGPVRQSRESADEQRTEFALWAMARSPLIMGGDLTRLDPLTRSLMTNLDLLFINQYATYSRPVDTTALGAAFANARVWRATINEPGARGYAEYFGFFNLAGKPATLRATWKQLGLDGAKHVATSIWDDATGKESKEINVTLPGHGSAVFQVK